VTAYIVVYSATGSLWPLLAFPATILGILILLSMRK
jgi:hypothetical protein